MGIADILGAITGEAPVSSSNSSPRPASLPPKRKAEDDLRNAAPKAPRTDSGVDRLSRPNGNSPRPSPRPTDKPSASSNGRLAPSSSRPPMKPSTLSASKPSTSTSASFSKTDTISNGSKPLPSRPATNSTPSAPPKRSSFAEIMARAKANSDIRESLGKINHKPLERNLTMKERKELKGEDAKKAKGAARNGPPSRSSSASAPSRVPGKNGAERSRVSPTVSSASVKAKAKAQAAEEEKKKVKKAALATTGYTGTARPRPGASSTSKAGSSTRGDDRDRSYGRSRYGGPLSAPRSRRRDEEDSELDDFIVDDEDEDDYGRPEPEYYSDDESDMEAGIDDIDAEETAAERRARLEDQQEQLLEIRLKREKEERKRRALEALKRRP